MFNVSRIGVIAATVATLFSANAFADSTLFQTAGLNDFESGDYWMDSTRGFGAAFQLTSGADITSIGGNFTMFSDGSLFGALVKLTGLNGTPVGDLATNSLAHVLFNPVGGEQSVALTTHLDAGYYAVVFGTGLFGADGTSGLVTGQDTIGSPSIFAGTDGNWASFDAPDVRMFVNGNITTAAVPEPADWSLMVAGIGALAAVARRRKTA